MTKYFNVLDSANKDTFALNEIYVYIRSLYNITNVYDAKDNTKLINAFKKLLEIFYLKYKDWDDAVNKPLLRLEPFSMISLIKISIKINLSFTEVLKDST